MNKKVLNCSYCHSDVEKKFECKICKAVFHEDCYEENGGCSILGCEASVDEEIKKNSSIENTKDLKEKKSVSNKEKDKPKDKNSKNSKVLISILIITLIPWLILYPSILKKGLRHKKSRGCSMQKLRVIGIY